MLCICARVASSAAAIFSMTCSLFFSLLLAVSVRQVDIASKAAFTAWRVSSESPGTDIELKLRNFAELSSMARFLSLRMDFVDVLPDRGEAFAGDLFERRPAGSPEICATFQRDFADISEIAVGTLITERPPHRAE